MGTAIVAIPREEDYVWNISSEKIPHMTLLFLGDQANNPKLNDMVDYIQHAVETSLSRFGMQVDRRGVLGSDNADVLFFDKSWSFKNIERFRGYLLKNSDIFAAYAGAQQFDGWTPHLTLGYPATPAKKDSRDYPGISYVSFDKIAIWTGDFEGPTFDIPHDEGLSEAFMSDPVDSILAHHGVKGMKWGVRNGAKSVGKAVDNTVFTLGANSETIQRGISSRANSLHKEEMKAINSKPKYKESGTNKVSKRLRSPRDPLTKEYRGEAKAAYLKSLEKAANEMTNVQGTKQYTVRDWSGRNPNKSTWMWSIAVKDVQHSAMDMMIEVQPIYGEDGLLTSVEVVKNSMTQSDLTADDILEHFGVRGMHWGVRNKTPKSDVRSPDSVRAKAAQDIIKKHGTKALDNKELQHLVTRMNLERQYNTIMASNPGTVKRGQSKVKDILSVVKTAQEVYTLANGPLAKDIRKALNGGASAPKISKPKAPGVKVGFV